MLLTLDPLYWLMLAPALLLGLWAQMRVHSTFAQASQVPAPLSGAAAARHVLDSAGLQNVAIEPVDGLMTDHYDPRAKVLRLSEPVYHERTMAAVGVAAHEAGHALQDATGIRLLRIRNAMVPLANFGGGISMMLMMLGFILSSLHLIQIGIIAFSATVFFQLVNLPVEFDASNRAKAQLDALGYRAATRSRPRALGAQRGRLDVRRRHAAGRFDTALFHHALFRQQPLD